MLDALFIAAAARQSTAAKHAQLTAQRAEHSATKVRTQNETIRFDIEKLYMITEALWEILKREHGYTDEQLVGMIDEIDLRDGKLDGKVAKAAERPRCDSCGRTLMRNQIRCLYCGEHAPRNTFER